MKILVLGHGGLNFVDRIEELRRLGHDVTAESLYPTDRHLFDRYSYKWAVRAGSGPWIDNANQALLRRTDHWGMCDLIWIEKAQYIRKSTIEIIKAKLRAPIVHFTPDIAIQIKGTQHSPIFHQAIPAYNTVITMKDFEAPMYSELGAAHTIYMDQAVNHKRLFPRIDIGKGQKARIGFIGHFEPHYLNTVRAIARSGLDVKARGPGWDKPHRRFNPAYRAYNAGGPIYGEEYAKQINRMGIGLGLLSKLGPEIVTTRSLEIPACGTFLLAERTKKHQEMFREGEEAEFFDSTDELLGKAQFYVKHAGARERIAAAGHQRFLASPYRWDRQMAKTIMQLTRQLSL